VAGRPVAEAAALVPRVLASLATSRGSNDNITCLFVDLRNWVGAGEQPAGGFSAPAMSGAHSMDSSRRSTSPPAASQGSQEQQQAHTGVEAAAAAAAGAGSRDASPSGGGGGGGSPRSMQALRTALIAHADKLALAHAAAAEQWRTASSAMAAEVAASRMPAAGAEPAVAVPCEGGCSSAAPMAAPSPQQQQQQQHHHHQQQQQKPAAPALQVAPCAFGPPQAQQQQQPLHHQQLRQLQQLQNQHLAAALSRLLLPQQAGQAQAAAPRRVSSSLEQQPCNASQPTHPAQALDSLQQSALSWQALLQQRLQLGQAPLLPAVRPAGQLVTSDMQLGSPGKRRRLVETQAAGCLGEGEVVGLYQGSGGAQRPAPGLWAAAPAAGKACHGDAMQELPLHSWGSMTAASALLALRSAAQ
jgi:hypothetical protein